MNLIVIKNPFNPQSDYTRKQVTHIPGEPVFAYAQGALMLPEEETEIILNSRILDHDEFRTVIPSPDDYVIVLPRVAGNGREGKTILSLVASIGLMYLSMGVGNLVQGAISHTAVTSMAAWSSPWAYIAAAGAQVAGGLLISAMFPAPDMDTKTSSTYSWGGIEPLVGQNQPVPVILGTVRVAGQIVSQHISSKGTSSYLNMLIEAGEGPCDYEIVDGQIQCTGIDNIKINNNPIANFSGIEIHKRAGLNDQPVIPNFNDTYNDYGLTIELNPDASWPDPQTIGEDVQVSETEKMGLELTFNWPGGLYDVVPSGGMGENYVTFEIQYKLHSKSDWQNYYEYYSKAVTATVNGAKIVEPGNHRSEYWPGRIVKVLKNGIRYETTIGSISFDYVYPAQGVSTQYTVLHFSDPQFNSGVTEVGYFDTNILVKGNDRTAFFKIYRFDDLPKGQYDVRCRMTGYKYNNTNEGDMIRTVWTQVSQINYDDYFRPNKILLGITALAKEQLNGSRPTVTFELTRSNVWVWNPDENEYQEKPANNPAWAAYWLLHRVYQLKNINTGLDEFIVRGVPAKRLNYQEFAEWADFCQPENQTIRHLEVNIYFDTVQKLRDALKYVEELGRGRVIPRGTSYGCIFDGPVEKDASGKVVAAQLFNMSNTGLDSFSTQYVDASDRATAIEVTYFDRAHDYQRSTILIPADGLDQNAAVVNPTQITLTGCTNRDQAWKEGKYRLRLNNYLRCTAFWKADIDAIVSRLGQVVMIQHDVPAWGVGGRVLEVDQNMVTIDKPVVLETGKNYEIMIRLNDDTIIVKTVTEVDETGKILTVSTPFEDVPEPDNPYNFGETGRTAKPFRLIDIKRDGESRCTLTGMEYIDEIYSEADNVPEIDYSSFDEIFEVINLSVTEQSYHQGNGVIRSQLNCSWSCPRGKIVDEYWVYYSIYGSSQWNFHGKTSKESTAINDVTVGNSYVVKVCTFRNPVVSSGTISTAIQVTGCEFPLPDITGLSSYYQNNHLWLTWNRVDDFRNPDYEIRKGDDYNSAQILGRVVDNRYQAIGNGTYWIAAHTPYVYSDWVSIVISGASVTANILKTWDEQITGWTGTLSGSLGIGLGNDSPYLSTGASSGTYTCPDTHIVDLGTAQKCNLSANYSIALDSFSNSFWNAPNTWELANTWGLYSQYGNADVLIKIAQNNEEDFGEWQKFVPGEQIGRKFLFGITLYSYDPDITVILNSFSFTVDMPDRSDPYQVTTGTGYTTLMFTRPFHEIPVPTGLILNAESGDRLVIRKDDITVNDLKVKVINDSTGQDVQRIVNLLVRGY